MKNNVYRKYQNLHLGYWLLSLPLSLSALYIVYLCISLYGYKQYGLAIFEQRWAVRPTFWQEARAFFQLTIGWKGVVLWVGALLLDGNFWPYFYNLKNAKIENEIEPGTTSGARTTSRASEMGSDRASEV